MKEIKAMIRPEMFETVYEALRTENYCCLTVYNGEGIGRHGDPDKLNASLDFPFLHSKIVKLEILIEDDQEKEVMKILQKSATTNSAGDGIIYSTKIDTAVSVRTGEEGKTIL